MNPILPRVLPRAIAAVFAGLLVAVAAATGLAAPVAQAAPVAIEQGHVDWGVKASFRGYVGDSGITVHGPATRNGDGSFRFPVVSGSYDPETKSTRLELDGGVGFYAHEGLLEMLIDDLTLEISPDGGYLRGDVDSRDHAAVMVAYEGIDIVSLDLADAEPQVGETQTRWNAVPSRLTTQSQPAFGGHYYAGQLVDPITIDYAGPGGKPIPAVETWTAPGTPHFERLATSASFNGGSVRDLVFDGGRDVIHALQNSFVRAVDPDSLQSLAFFNPAAVLQPFGLAYDAETADLFAVKGDGGIAAARWTGTGYSSQPSPGTAKPTIRWVAQRQQLVSFGINDSSSTVLTRGAPWAAASFPSLAGVGSFVPTGAVVAPDGRMLVSGRDASNAPRPALLVDHSGETPVATQVAGTGIPEWAPGDDGIGYTVVAAGPDGSAVLQEAGPKGRVLRLEWESGTYVVDGDPIEVGNAGRGLAVDPGDGTIYARTQQGDVFVIRGDEVVSSFPLANSGGLGLIGAQTAAEGTFYGALNESVVAYGQTGESPTVTGQPAPVEIDLGVGEGSREVTFAAAADGTPAPAVRWQSRAPGTPHFADLEGETAGELTFAATAALSGMEYRAVFGNAGGEIASAPATLSVRAAPSVVVEPSDVSVTEGDAATFKALPAGLPYPDLKWQRLDGGTWVDVPGETAGEMVLTTTAAADDGARYRLELSNELGTVHSRVATLTVKSPIAERVTFGGGYMEWGIHAPWRCYVVGTIARGGIDVAGGVTRAPGTAASGPLCPEPTNAGSEALRFPVLGGSYDPATGRLEVDFDGSVRFWGHDFHIPGDLTPQLDTSFSNLRLVVQDGRGTLYADARGATMDNPLPVTRTQVDLVDVDATASSPRRESGGLSWQPIATKLSLSGAAVFGSYAAGTSFDALSLSLVHGTPRERPTPPDPPVADPPPAAQPQPPRRPRIQLRRGTIRLGPAARRVVVGTVACPGKGPACRIAAPKRVRLTAGRARAWAAVKAPKRIESGRRAQVVVQLTPAARRLLAKRPARVRVPVRTSRSGAKPTTSIAAVRLISRSISAGR